METIWGHSQDVYQGLAAWGFVTVATPAEFPSGTCDEPVVLLPM